MIRGELNKIAALLKSIARAKKEGTKVESCVRTKTFNTLYVI